MADCSSLLLPLFFCLFLFFHGCLAQLELPQQGIWQELEEQMQHRLRAKTPCNISRLYAHRPSINIPSEAGETKLWDSSNNPEFECAGVEVEQKTLHRNGLELPHYSNAPRLYFFIQGKGIFGAVIPGCAETFESQESFQEKGQGQQGQKQKFIDRHQKLRRIQQGDILAVPAGYTHWTYNDGDVPLVFISLIDVANEVNQLDLQFRNFFLAGNSKSQGQQEEQGKQEQQGQQGEKGKQQEQGQQGEQGKQGQQGQYRNIFSEFDDELLAKVFRVPKEIISKLKGQQDQRGSIVRAERLQLSLPEFDEQEKQQQEGKQGGEGEGGSTPNGLEETICTAKLGENIAHIARADFYNPRAGRLSTVNSQTLPILAILKLSAEHANLYSNAILAPHWVVNAHSIIYVIRGSAKIQVVGDIGNRVFDDEVNQGQLIIVPQNFAVILKAGNQGVEFISFKTNDNAMSSQLAGRLSAIRAIPLDILANAYRLSKEEVRSLKFRREEATLFSGSESQGRRDFA